MRHFKFVSILTFLATSLFITDGIHAQAEMLWQREIPCGGANCGQPVLAVTDSGDVYVASMWGEDLLLSKFDYMGNLLWEQLYGQGGVSVSRPRQISADKTGAVYVSGEYDPDGTVTFGPKDYAFFTVKYAADGTLAWEDSYSYMGNSGSGRVYDHELANDESALYVAGSSGAIFDPYPPDPSSCPEYYSEDILIKYNAVTGNREWARDSVGTIFGLVAGSSDGVYSAATAEIDRGCCVDTLTNDSVS